MYISFICIFRFNHDSLEIFNNKIFHLLFAGLHVKGIKPKGIRPFAIKHRPKILYGIIRKQPPLRTLPIKRKIVASVKEPKYDVVYPYGLGGE